MKNLITEENVEIPEGGKKIVINNSLWGHYVMI